MLLLKGFSYCLNNPCKEILYQPTSSSVKFKAKSWIDIFGQRGSKALGLALRVGAPLDHAHLCMASRAARAPPTALAPVLSFAERPIATTTRCSS